MSKIVKVKNASGATDTWLGQQIANGVYYELQATEYVPWSTDQKVFDDIGTGNLVVNSGVEPDDDFANSVAGWNWLSGNAEPPRTVDGDWHIVAENFAHVTGNEGLNWTIEKYLDAGATFSEMMVIPSNRTFTLNFLEGGSFTVPTHIRLEWFEDIGGSVFVRRNPEIRLEEIYRTKVNGIHAASATVINMDNTNNELDTVEIGLYYGFKDGVNTTFYRKVTAVDAVADTVTLDTGLPASTGTTATGTANLVANAVDTITVTDGGTMYTSAPTVTISGDGTGATATAVMTGDVVTSVTVDTGGSGYTTATVTFGTPDGSILGGTRLGLTDRVIGQKANQIASSIINWTSPPQFFGDNVNYLKLTISNEDTVDAGLVTAMINGWHTDSTTGD